MHAWKKTILSALCFLLILSGAVVHAAALALPEGFVIGDHDGIHVDADGEYIINATGLLPGDVITKTLIISNYSDATTVLTMRAEPIGSSGPIDLLDAIDLVLELDGEVIYHGRVRGDEDVDMIKNPLPLGTYKIGDTGTLTATLTVDPTIVPSEEISKADVNWIFYGVHNHEVTPPPTGDIIAYAIYGLGAVMLILTILMLVLRKRKDLQQLEQDAPVM
ncbi:MAG: hypothetical protein LBJ11_02200 [Oscillospiraceae bacterium]|jgi:hypothetical protein|nr:hypothetical protein [Oscillospiraceae bacterium]